MNQEYNNISKAFKRDNERWNLELPELLYDFGEFNLNGGFDYSYCKCVSVGRLEYIDFKTSHRMTSDDYIRYYSNGQFEETLHDIVHNSQLEFTNGKDLQAITRIRNVEFKNLHNMLENRNFEYDDYEFFWRNDKSFSQWHKTNFKLNDTEYSSAEQFMMAKKAELFGDDDIKEQILSTNNVRRQKELGRQVKNFDESKWNESKIKIVYVANNLKFSQNEDLKVELLKTNGKLMVEASPVDSIWGIGVADDDPKKFNKANWRGHNLLGKILTQIREDMLVLEKYHT